MHPAATIVKKRRCISGGTSQIICDERSYHLSKNQTPAGGTAPFGSKSSIVIMLFQVHESNSIYKDKLFKLFWQHIICSFLWTRAAELCQPGICDLMEQFSPAGDWLESCALGNSSPVLDRNCSPHAANEAWQPAPSSSSQASAEADMSDYQATSVQSVSAPPGSALRPTIRPQALVMELSEGVGNCLVAVCRQICIWQGSYMQQSSLYKIETRRQRKLMSSFWMDCCGWWLCRGAGSGAWPVVRVIPSGLAPSL